MSPERTQGRRIDVLDPAKRFATEESIQTAVRGVKGGRRVYTVGSKRVQILAFSSMMSKQPPTSTAH